MQLSHWKRKKAYRAIGNELGINRKTVSKIWYQYIASEESLLSTCTDLGSVEQDYITEEIIGDIKYNTSSRSNIKLTQEIQKNINSF